MNDVGYCRPLFGLAPCAIMNQGRISPPAKAAKVAMASCLLALGMSTPAAAKTTTWVGGADIYWSTSGNWSDGAPGTGDTVTFAATSGNCTMNISGLLLAGMDTTSFTGHMYLRWDLAITGSCVIASRIDLCDHDLTVGGDLTIAAGAFVVMDDGLLPATLRVAGALELDGRIVATQSNVVIEGSFLGTSTGDFGLYDDATLHVPGATADFSGLTSFCCATTLLDGSGQSITTGSSIHFSRLVVTNGVTTIQGALNVERTLVIDGTNGGTLNRDDAPTDVANVSFVHSGQYLGGNGSFLARGSVDLAGSKAPDGFVLGSGGTTFHRFLLGDGSLHMGGHGVTFTGDVDLSGGGSIADEGPFLFAPGPRTYLPPLVLDPGNLREFALVAADLDGDGDLDLAAADKFSNAVSLHFQDAGTFATAPDLTIGPNTVGVPGDIAAADLDGDGDLDLVTAGMNDHLALFFQAAPGAFPAAPDREIRPGAILDQPMAVAVADMNGDGRPDLVSANFASDNLTVFLQTTTPGEFEATPSIVLQPGATLDGPINLAVADLEGDGDLDIAAVCIHSDDIVVFFQTAPGTFAPAVIAPGIALLENPYDIAAADLDGDGDLDLVTANDRSDNPWWPPCSPPRGRRRGARRSPSTAPASFPAPW
jgi:hypothetical protein